VNFDEKRNLGEDEIVEDIENFEVEIKVCEKENRIVADDGKPAKSSSYIEAKKDGSWEGF
jgi:hypothetical protein